MNLNETKKRLCFVTTNLHQNAGGMTQSIFTRSNLLSPICDQITILTMYFKPSIKEMQIHYRDRYGLSGNIVFLTVFDILADEDIFRFGCSKKTGSECLDGFVVEESYDDERRFSTRSIYSEKSLLAQEWQDADGNLLRKRLFSPERKPRKDIYFAPNGRKYLFVNYDENGKAINYIWRDKTGHNLAFSSLSALHQAAIDKFSHKEPATFFLIESPKYFHLALNRRNTANASRWIVTIHDNHFEAPFKPGSKVNPYAQSILRNHEAFDAIVFLTKEQLLDVEAEYGMFPNSHVIQHPFIAQYTQKKKQIAKERKRITVISRLDNAQKQLDQLLLALSFAIAEDPEITLHLFGTGPDKEKLEKQIKELGLQSNCFLRGHTSTPRDEFARGEISVISSSHEGLSLTILESLSAGTPVISYRAKYGPADVINDGRNGRLVPRDRPDLLARAIVDTLTDPSALSMMSKEALKSPLALSPNRILSQWADLFVSIEKKTPSASAEDCRGAILECRVKSCSISNTNSDIHVDLSLAIKTSFPLPQSTKIYLHYNPSLECNNDETTRTWKEISRYRSSETSHISAFSLDLPVEICPDFFSGQSKLSSSVLLSDSSDHCPVFPHDLLSREFMDFAKRCKPIRFDTIISPEQDTITFRAPIPCERRAASIQLIATILSPKGTESLQLDPIYSDRFLSASISFKDLADRFPYFQKARVRFFLTEKPLYGSEQQEALINTTVVKLCKHAIVSIKGRKRIISL